MNELIWNGPNHPIYADWMSEEERRQIDEYAEKLIKERENERSRELGLRSSKRKIQKD